ncbi:MAG: dicarboxylate/amino acid:cation symporter [Gemmatimonadaceae bacterium]
MGDDRRGRRAEHRRDAPRRRGSAGARLSSLRRFTPRSPAARAAIGLVLGFALGLALAATSSSAARSLASGLDAIGTVWVNGIRMTVVPLVVSLLVSTIVRERDMGSVGRMGRRAIAIYVVMLTVIAVIGLLVAPPLLSRIQVDASSSSALRASASGVTAQMPTFAQWLVSLVPSNVVKAATDGAILPLIIFALVLALALAHSEPRVREPVAQFFGAIATAVLVIVKWVLAAAPIGVFALAVPLAMRVGAGVAGAAALFVALHCGMLACVIALFYPVAAMLGRVPVRRFAKALLPAQLVVVATRSSLAALPAMIDGAERVLEIPPHIAGFALPFGVSLARVNTAASWIASAVFLGKLYGVPLTFMQLVLLAGMAIPMSFSVPGIPSAGLFIIAPAFMTVGIPVEGIGILIALDAIPDIFKTMVNVTGQMTTAVLLARYEPKEATEPGVQAAFATADPSLRSG